MEYTVNTLAKLVGVTARALHWYDEIGLLSPSYTTEAGYRMYGAEQVDMLQQILFYKTLGIKLESIKNILTAPDFNRSEALEKHRETLCAQREQIDALLLTLDKTIQAEKGEITMTDSEKFEGFKKKLVDENEEKYGAETRRMHGDKTVDESNAKLMHLTKEQYDAMQTLGEAINTALCAAVQASEVPSGQEGTRIAQMHKEWLAFTWPKYSAEAHRGLAQMYTADERFTAYYDKEQPGCAQFLCDAIQAATL